MTMFLRTRKQRIAKSAVRSMTLDAIRRTIAWSQGIEYNGLHDLDPARYVDTRARMTEFLDSWRQVAA